MQRHVGEEVIEADAATVTDVDDLRAGLWRARRTLFERAVGPLGDCVLHDIGVEAEGHLRQQIHGDGVTRFEVLQVLRGRQDGRHPRR